MIERANSPGAKVRYPSAVTYLPKPEDAIPGVLLNDATIALAHAGAGLDDLLAFRRQARSGGMSTLVNTILAWMLVA